MMSDDINYRMCKAEMTTDNELRKQVAEHLIKDFLIDRNGRPVDKAIYKNNEDHPGFTRDGVDYTARLYFGTFQLEAVAHCANDVRMDAFQVRYMYDDSGHFVHMATSGNSRR
jgi:hypothetical protein